MQKNRVINTSITIGIYLRALMAMKEYIFVYIKRKADNIDIEIDHTEYHNKCSRGKNVSMTLSVFGKEISSVNVCDFTMCVNSFLYIFKKENNYHKR